MIKNVKLNDIYKLDLQDAEIQRTNGKRALLIDLEVSASGKVTNGRIYPPEGHKAGIKSWTHPYGKVVITHHNDKGEPIGRFVGAEYQDLDREALAFLKGDYAALAAIKRAFASKDVKAIYDVMERYNCFDKEWPGLGRVIGKIRVSDQTAVEKFMDGLYYTFSAGQSTDAFICMKCGTDRFSGEGCEHEFGGRDEDGKPNIYMCGRMEGRELSVVNIPANDTSFPLRMEMEDSDGGAMTLCIIDSVEGAPTIKPHIVYDMENSMNLQDLQALELGTVLDLLAEEEKLEQFTAALASESQKDTEWLVKLLDALRTKHSIDDQTPAAIKKLHDLLEGSVPAPEPAKPAENLAKLLADTQTKLAEDIAQIRAFMERIDGIKDEKKEDNQETEVQVSVATEPATAVVVDWATWDLALDALVGDGKLSDEQRAALDAKAFCGPERLFPIADARHLTAAMKLVERAKLADSEKALIRQWIESRAKDMGVNPSCKCHEPCKKCADADAKYEELKKDYSEALKQYEDTKAKLESVLLRLSEKLDSSVDNSEQKLDDLLVWFDNVDFDAIANKRVVPARNLKPTENPSVTRTDHTVSETSGTPKVSRFVQDLIDTYRGKLRDEGEQEANEFLNRNLDYLPDDFQISNYISKE